MKLWQNKPRNPPVALFSNPEQLLEEAIRYFNFCDGNPWYRAELVTYQGYGSEEDVTLGRPYSISGFCVFLGVSEGYFRARKSILRGRIDSKNPQSRDEEMLETIERIETIIRTQQIEGGMLGVFNASLTARINGLSENVATTGEPTRTIINITTRDAETTANLEELTKNL